MSSTFGVVTGRNLFIRVNLHICMALNPLTETQSRLWQLRDRGLNLSQIGRMVGVSRQSVSKTLIQADRTVRQTLVDAAKSYKITVYRINHGRGILSGFSKALNSPVLMTFSPGQGLHVWYKHTGICEGCDQEVECRETILAEAERLGVSPEELTPRGVDPGSYPPARLAERLFHIVFPKGVDR